MVAIADGTVTRSYFSTSYGNIIFIQHEIKGEKYESVYAHMAQREVEEGVSVKQGQMIGIIGDTGNTSGIHLHFELHQNNWTLQKENSLNPVLYIAFND